MISASLLQLLAPLLRRLPVDVATAIYWRFFHARCEEFSEAFEAAPLRFAPQVKMRLKVADAAHGPMALIGAYETALSREILRLAREGGTLMDVGANYGYFSLIWCAARSDNQAVAVEASPRNLDGLGHNIEMNGFAERIKVAPFAASDLAGEAMFDLGPSDQTGWGGLSRSGSQNTVVVPCQRLDEQFAGRPISVMKIDCEGADSLIISGASGLLDKKLIKHVFYEENGERMKLLGLSAGSGRAILERHGYRVRQVQDGTDFHAWLP